MTALLQRIFSMVDREHLPHGLLFVGPEHSQKEPTALALAQKLICPEETGLVPCLTCAACKNASEDNHPDVRILRPDKQELTIEQVRELQRWLQIGPYEAKRKVAIFHEAHALNLAAANALLKTLEEPPPHAILILTTSSPDLLPRTVHSRLMLIRFPEEDDAAAREEIRPEWLDDLEAHLLSPHARSPEEVFDLTQRLAKERGELRYFFAALERCLRDRLHRAVEQELPHMYLRQLEDLFDQTLETERQILRRYGNIGLHVDHLLLAYNSLSPSAA